MALNEPQSVTLATIAQSLPRTSTGTNTSTYTKEDGTVVLTVAHAYARRIRRTARLTTNKITTDPLITAQNVRVNATCYVVLDVPVAGFSSAEQKDLLLALATWLSATTGANAGKLVGGEN